MVALTYAWLASGRRRRLPRSRDLSDRCRDRSAPRCNLPPARRALQWRRVQPHGRSSVSAKRVCNRIWHRAGGSRSERRPKRRALRWRPPRDSGIARRRSRLASRYGSQPASTARGYPRARRGVRPWRGGRPLLLAVGRARNRAPAWQEGPEPRRAPAAVFEAWCAYSARPSFRPPEPPARQGGRRYAVASWRPGSHQARRR
jgi:hypothetical protein